MDGSQTVFCLQRGSTGFRSLSDPPVPETDSRACRAAWYAAARAARGQVRDFTEKQYPQNFHTGTINDRDGTHFGLFHAQYLLIAFVGDRRQWYTAEFQEPPAWAVALGEFGFTVLGASLLLSPLTGADSTALSAAERKQIRYWQPETLGATLFKFWD
ncbi:hypothetical protein [Streptomyces sp. NPDC059224]|uniref:hypothetical protein n=1 Tax=Streptomyces sp. NPDC059224 TaxID=3346775 RepID=UPI0036A63BDF